VSEASRRAKKKAIPVPKKETEFRETRNTRIKATDTRIKATSARAVAKGKALRRTKTPV
jgi:hypothetical protein